MRKIIVKNNAGAIERSRYIRKVEALCHEDIGGTAGTASLFFSRGKDPRRPLDRTLGRHPSRFWTVWSREKSVVRAGN
jgi:hypothetical protein